MYGRSQIIEYTALDNCPSEACDHLLTYHTKDGCLVDWEWDDEGVAVTDGCMCNLTMATGS